MLWWWIGFAAAKEVALPCPEVGEQVTYRVRTESMRAPSRESELRSHGAFLFTHTFTVDRIDGPLLEVTLTPGPSEVLVPHPDPLMAEVMAGISGAEIPPLPVRIDTEAMSITYVDPQPVIDLQLRVLDALLPKLAERFPEAPPGLDGQLRQMLASPEMAQRSLAESGLPLAQFMCGRLKVGELSYESQVPNPTGGPAIDTRGTVTVAAKGRRVHIEIHEFPTEESVKAAGLAMARRLGVVPEQLEAAVAEMRLETRTDVSVDATTKDPWPTWTSSRTIAVGGAISRQDTWVVERVR